MIEDIDRLNLAFTAKSIVDPIKRYNVTIHGKGFSDEFVLDTSDLEYSIKEFKNFIIQSRNIPLLDQSYIRIEYEQIFIN